MRTTFGLFAAWTGATLLAIAVAAAAIGSVRTQLVDDTAVLRSPSAAALASISDTAVPDDGVPAQSEAPSDSGNDTTGPDLSTTSDDSPTTTLTDVDHDATSSTTAVPTTTEDPTTTTAAPTSYTQSFVTEGGTVVIMVSDNSVTYVNSQPNLGWTAEVKDEGPEKVVVKFEMNEEEDEEEEIKFTAKIEDGELEIKISQD